LKGEGENLILLGEFGRAHGLRGEVRLKSFTAEPAAIAAYGPLAGDDGRRFVLTGVRPAGGAPDMLVARVEGVETREAAEALNRVRLHAPRGRLPPPEEGEFLAADLIGLAVETAGGETLGTIVSVPDYGGGDLLEIAPAGGGPTALLPFTKAFVPTVDLAGRRVVVDAPKDLFEARTDDRQAGPATRPG
jgi:16S rRNA processing protein RimM